MEDESPKGLLQRAWGGLQGIWLWLLRILVAVFLAWLLFWLMGITGLEDKSSLMITIEKAEEEESDVKISQKDQTLWTLLIPVVDAMEHGDFILNGEKAREFGQALYPESENIYVKEIHFYHKEKMVEILYDLGINKQVHLVMTRGKITRSLTRYEGFSEGDSIRRYFLWFTYGRFRKGYPVYELSADIENSAMYPVKTVTKTTVCLKPFSKITRILKILAGAASSG